MATPQGLGPNEVTDDTEDFLTNWLSELVREDCPVRLVFQSADYGDLSLSFGRLSALTAAMQKPRSDKIHDDGDADLPHWTTKLGSEFE